MTVDIPAPIQNIIGRRSFTRDTIGMSGSRVLCFEDMVLKITPAKEGAEADQECRMMAWLSGKLPVPQILCVQRERGVHYLLMSRTAGQMACAPQWLAQPDQLVRILAQGVRMLQRVDIRDCPRRLSLIHIYFSFGSHQAAGTRARHIAGFPNGRVHTDGTGVGKGQLHLAFAPDRTQTVSYTHLSKTAFSIFSRSIVSTWYPPMLFIRVAGCKVSLFSQS